MKVFSKRITLFIIIIITCSSQYMMGQDGEALFKQTCAACHKLGQKFIGPDLIGVSDKRNHEWIVSFIRSSQQMVKAGDPEAVAIFKEFNEQIMTDQPNMSDGEINAIIAYIDAETLARGGTDATATGEEEEVEIIPIEYTEEDVEIGELLFSGKSRFANRGASCISCHNVDSDNMISGGVLAKDLTNAYSRLGDAGLAGIISTSPFPVMAAAYKNNALDSLEVVQLTAFLKRIDEQNEGQTATNDGNKTMLTGGFFGLIALFTFIGFFWRRRLKESTKDSIYKR